MDSGAKHSNAFLSAIAFILPHEEQFARGHWGDENFVVTENVSGDSGGLTKYGIDRKSHPGVDIARLTRAGAIAIYWTEWLFRRLDLLPEKLAVAVFDVFVNGGTPIRWLQAAINKVGFPMSQHLAARDFKLPLTVDGDPGRKTLAAAAACDQAAVLRYFIGQRDARFVALAHGPRAKFLKGWEARDRDLEKYLAAA